MVRNHRAVSDRSLFAILLVGILLLTVLAGCVHYVPREDRTKETTEAEEITTQPDTTESESDTTVPLDTAFPNEPEDGHTKRY